MADWNAKLAAKEPLDSGIGENIPPTPYALEDMPEKTHENRILFLEFLAAKSLTTVNTHTIFCSQGNR